MNIFFSFTHYKGGLGKLLQKSQSFKVVKRGDKTKERALVQNAALGIDIKVLKVG